MNWYAYCRNNSANFVDPSGMVGRFLDSEDGLLRYEGEDGTITTFEGDDALQQWMDWYDFDLHSRGILASQLVGYKMAGGDANLNKKLLFNIQAMIALGYDAAKVREAEDDGVRIQIISHPDGDKYESWNKTVYWNGGADADGTNAMMWLAHEVEHAWQDASGHFGYYDSSGNWVPPREGNLTMAKVEEGAMIAANDMGLAFYKKVPGYGKGGSYETKGPYTTYWGDGISLITGVVVPAPRNMTWDDYEKMRWFICVY